MLKCRHPHSLAQSSYVNVFEWDPPPLGLQYVMSMFGILNTNMVYSVQVSLNF
jgi:hypothetical protein